jgi:hypothetical protein
MQSVPGRVGHGFPVARFAFQANATLSTGVGAGIGVGVAEGSGVGPGEGVGVGDSVGVAALRSRRKICAVQ